MSKPSAPAAPDLVGAAQQTGQSNIQAAIAQALLGHVNQVTPFGTQTWSQGSPSSGATSSNPGSSPSPSASPNFDGGGGTGLLASSGNTFHASNLGSTIGGALEGSIFPGGTTPGQLGGPLGTLLNPKPTTPTSPTAPSGGTTDLSSLPQFTETTTLSPQQQAIFDAQQGTQGTTARAAGQIAGNINTSPLDFSGAPAMPSGADQATQLKNVQDALYARQSQYLDPQFAKSQDQLNTQLANQGFQTGDAGVSNSAGTGAQDSFNMAKQKAYADARDSAVTGASNQLVQNTNTALAQRQQAISEALAQRNQPINELAALGGGGSIGMPQFPSSGGSQGIAGPDYLGAAGAQNAANLQNYGIQSGQYNSQVGGLMGLGSLAALLFA